MGLESRMEGTRWKEGDVRNSTSSSNYRLNTIRCILGENYVSNRSLHWTEVLNPSEHYGLTDDHQDALHAVLLRNRDRTATTSCSLTKYAGILPPSTSSWISISANMRWTTLRASIPKNPADRDYQTYWHYTSSSADGDHSWVLWAEECAALGNYDDSHNTVGGQYAYRCIRNLGIGLDDPNVEPTPLIPKVTHIPNSTIPTTD